MRDEDAVISMIDMVESKYGPINVGVYNIGANVRFSVAETSARVYRKVWEMATLGGFFFGKEISKRMAKYDDDNNGHEMGRGCILFTGATASIRGSSGFSAFASAKSALRTFAQSLAKECGPKRIHVSHIIVDGAIDGPFIRSLMNGTAKGKGLPLSAAMSTQLNESRIMKPRDIAESYWFLYQQKPSAWTFEMDLRPFCEKW